MFTVNVSPDMAMYTLLISQGYDPSFALCEFIDNAIHAHNGISKDKFTPLHIKVMFYSNQSSDPASKNIIVIEDDGPGISEETLKLALKPAKRPSNKGLSEFGIGMKAAAVWFADEWTLDTWPKGEKTHLRTTFNLVKLLEKGKDTIDVKTLKEGDGKHGTKITLKLLRRDIRQDSYEYICKNISEIYQRYISGKNPQVNITVYFNGTPNSIEFTNHPVPALVSPKHIKKASKTYSLGESIEWKTDVDFKFNDHQVSGLIYLREVGSYPNNPGLVLFRHNRVICGITQKKYIPLDLYKTSNKARAMRVYGELDLDDYPVSYTKDRFTFDDKEFIDALRKNVKMLDELLTQADNYRTKNVEPYESDMTVNGADKQINTTSNSVVDSNANTIEEGVLLAHPDTIQAGGDSERTHESNVTHTEVINARNDANHDKGSECLDNRPDTRIQESKALVVRLNSLNSKKHIQIYNSLCKISLVSHPAFMYVGAWMFFESLARLSGSKPNTDFYSYFCSKINNWNFDKGQKSSFKKSLKDIAEEGNCTKHCSVSVPVDAKQLAVDFEVLEPLMLKVIDEIIASRNHLDALKN